MTGAKGKIGILETPFSAGEVMFEGNPHWAGRIVTMWRGGFGNSLIVVTRASKIERARQSFPKYQSVAKVLCRKIIRYGKPDWEKAVHDAI